MANLFLSGIAPRSNKDTPRDLTPESVLKLYGFKAVEGCWSGLYGSSSTREGIKLLMQASDKPHSIFRVICKVPGGIVSYMAQQDLADLGYLNVRYADAALHHMIGTLWADYAGYDDPQEAILTHPEFARDVAEAVAPASLSLIIHPFRVKGTELILSAGTILDTNCVTDIHSRDRTLNIELR